MNRRWILISNSDGHSSALWSEKSLNPRATLICLLFNTPWIWDPNDTNKSNGPHYHLTDQKLTAAIVSKYLRAIKWNEDLSDHLFHSNKILKNNIDSTHTHLRLRDHCLDTLGVKLCSYMSHMWMICYVKPGLTYSNDSQVTIQTLWQNTF